MGNTSKRCSYCGNDLNGSDLDYTEGIVIKARFCCRECMYKWREKHGKQEKKGCYYTLCDYSGPNGATHSGAFGASIPVHSAPPPKWRKLGLETGE